MSNGRYIKNASDNWGVRQGLSAHVIVEEHLHIVTFGSKSHSANFVTLFFCKNEPAYILQINDGYELR
jgi:hypothetical protein